jgi:hypothetical protein
MQSSNLSDEEWNKWLPLNYIFTIIKNMFFTVAVSIRKNPPSDNSMDNHPYDELFEKPITPL